VKKSAAYSLGKLVQNNPKKYLSNLLSSVASKNMEFLYLLSLKEFLMGSKFGSYTTDEVWDLLQSVAKGDLEEGNLNIVSECFCRISIQSSGHYEKLQQLIHNENAKLRVVAMGAIKYAFGMNVDLDDNAVMPFFALLNDPELLVRRAALSALHAVVHFRPELIAGHIDAVLPILYSQTIYNESLVKTVQFGPMQHKIDSGLDARKIAFQVVLLLLEKNLAGPNADFVQAVVNGISDPDHDISTISLKIVVKMCKLEHLMSHYMSGIVLEIEKTIDKQKPKLDNQKLQGQDRERAKELILFCLATLLTFDKLQPIPAILSKYEKEHKLMHEARELEQAQIK
jgi:cullin-associated NEDD8-dissociated protein 1